MGIEISRLGSATTSDWLLGLGPQDWALLLKLGGFRVGVCLGIGIDLGYMLEYVLGILYRY